MWRDKALLRGAVYSLQHYCISKKCLLQPITTLTVLLAKLAATAAPVDAARVAAAA
jgi:hypothetical protein